MIGDVLGSQPENAGQDHRPSLLVRHVVECTTKPVHVARPDGGVGRIGLARRGQQPLELIGVHGVRAGLGPHRVDGDIPRDHAQPGRDAPAPGIERLGMAPGAHERLLGEIFGESGIAGDRERYAVDASLEPRDEGLGGAGVAHREPRQQRLVRQSPHTGTTNERTAEITAETSVTWVISVSDRPVLVHMIATSTTDAARVRRWMWLCARGLGALSLLAVGAVHLQQYEDLYSTIPTIGQLFLLNFIAATVLGLGLLVPFERLFRRWGALLVAALALGGIAVAAGSYVFLLIAERRPLFGFMEPGYNPAAIRTAQVSEITTVALLGLYLAARHVPIGSPNRRPTLRSTFPREVRT